MIERHSSPRPRLSVQRIGVVGWVSLTVLLLANSCVSRSQTTAPRGPVTLRVGVGGLPQQSPQAGLRQFVANLSMEGLINLNEDGRARPFLAERWSQAADDLSLTFELQPRAKFHDGTPITGVSVAEALKHSLPTAMRAAFEDVDDIEAIDERRVRIRLRRPSPFVLEALDTTLEKPGKTRAGTGAFIPTDAASERLEANGAYYLGRPLIDRIAITAYPSVRTAWAELLRGNLDMLSEVNVDALESLEASSNVSVFSFTRHYQYMIVFSPTAGVFRSAEIRRELNAAIDRDAIVTDALNGRGIPSSGPVPPRHWALSKSAPRFSVNAALAKNLAARHLKFTCLVPADSVYERVALAVRQQLAASGVDMQVEEATQEQVVAAADSNKYEALLGDIISGPSLFRSYRHFHSKMSFAPQPIYSPAIDASLDRIRHARTDDEYRAGVTGFQQAIFEEPPAIFLVWGERARAVSRRFEIPASEAGRDVLATLRLWRPINSQQLASRN